MGRGRGQGGTGRRAAYGHGGWEVLPRVKERSPRKPKPAGLQSVAWNSSSTFGIPVTPLLMQGELKRTCSGQCKIPISFASVHSFLLDQAAGSPRREGRWSFHPLGPTPNVRHLCGLSIRKAAGASMKEPVMLGGVALF